MGILSGGEGARPTVRVGIAGGLGNQMFQAAAAMALAHRLGARLEFAPHRHHVTTVRQYELAAFDLNASLATIGRKQFSRKARRWNTLRNAVTAQRRRPITLWQEAGFHYDPTFERLSGNVIMGGYCQSPRYFNAIVDTVRRSFDLKPLLSSRSRDLCEAAAGENSVAVHIRRGDFTDPSNAKVHVVLGADYYARALDVLAAMLGSPRFFVVSDDVAAARAMLGATPNVTYAEGATMFDDMHLISSCRHKIIANSTFGWWGAWLDKREDAITIAPRAWFTRAVMMRSYLCDLFPPGWVTL